MPANSLYPGFMQIEYTSPYGAHVMKVPIVGYDDIDSGLSGVPKIYTQAGSGANVDASAGVTALVNLMKPFFETDTTFTSWTVFKIAAIGDPAVPAATGSIGIAGTTTPGTYWKKAVQLTWTWKCADFSIFKLVMLDAVSLNNFDKTTSLSGLTAEDALDTYVRGNTFWGQSRANGRPVTFLQRSKTLNEKLRRSYAMN